MPRHLKRHLVSMEERIVDSVGWRYGSALYRSLNATRPSMPNAPAADPAAHALVASFLNKALKVAFVRLKDLAIRLHLAPQPGPNAAAAAPRANILEQTYTAMVHIVIDHTWLLYGRTLDQILLCTLYGMCKASHLTAATFRAIISEYKVQPQARNDTIRCVSMTGPPPASPAPLAEENSPCADIIAFYNQVFLPEVSALLHSIAAGAIPPAAAPEVTLAAEPVAPMAPAAQQAADKTPVRHRPSHASPRFGLSPRHLISSPGATPRAPAPVKLSPGRWVVSPRGAVQLPTPLPPIAEYGAPFTGPSPTARKRPVENEGAGRQGKRRPERSAPSLDALLAAVADAQDAEDAEMRRRADVAHEGGDLPVCDLGKTFDACG